MKNLTRRDFLGASSLAMLGLVANQASAFTMPTTSQNGKRIGIIGLDTSHSIAFTKALNAVSPDENLKGYKVVCAFPYGSKTIETSASRIPGYIEDVKKLNVEVVDSISELLKKVDVVMLETNDGRLHLEQALPVMKAGKTLFIDKPIAASLEDAKKIFEAAKRYRVPVFTSSSLRYAENITDIKAGKLIGAVTGVDTYSPAKVESTHPDLYWYGVHGVEMLYAVMGVGCNHVVRVHTEGTDIVIGTWADGRVGVFRGIRDGKQLYGGRAFGTDGSVEIGKYTGYLPLLYKIIEFFETGVSPVEEKETLEIFAFMEAAERSKELGGAAVSIEQLLH